MRKITYAVAAATALAVHANPACAADDKEIQTLKQQILEMQKQIAKLEAKQDKQPEAAAPQPVAVSKAGPDNSFNPAIGLVLNGEYGAYSQKSSNLAGFGIGEEGGRPNKGFNLGESELNFNANIDDKLYGNMTASIVNDNGEAGVELEEAFIQTTPGMGLPEGLSVKAGRALWTIGYLNEHHAHTDDFADRPLPYRAFLNNAYNDDGFELDYVLPTELYTEVGGGAFKGDDFPFGGSNAAIGAWSAFARIGGDIGDDQTWRLGAYVLSGKADNQLSNDDNLVYQGDNRLYAADIHYTWAPTGNNQEQEFSLQGEYFLRDLDGTYEDIAAGTGAVPFSGNQSGWYGQAVYKFAPEWRVGARYSQLYSADTPAGLVGSEMDANGFNPYSISFMGDWTNSEFSRIRAQYNREELSRGADDNQFLLQYVVSLGAHGAHQY